MNKSNTQTKAHESNVCLCGCKVKTTRNFAPGHDARLHSLVLRVAKGEADKKELPKSPRVRAYLVSAPWMTKKIAKSIGLEKSSPRQTSASA